MGKLEADYQVIQQERCAANFWAFAKHCKTYDAQTFAVTPFPTDWQYLHDLVDDVENLDAAEVPGEDGLPVLQVAKHRQLLITWLFGAVYSNWLAYRARLYDEVWTGGAISKRLDDAKEVLNRFTFVYEHLDPFLKGPKPKTDQKTLIEFNDQVSFRVLPASEDIGRTYTFSYLFMDEAAFARYARKIWGSIAATMSKKSKAVVVSTRNGRFNWFGEKWFAKNSWKKRLLHWYDRPDRDQKWYEAERKKYDDPREFDREHGDSWDTFAGKPVFGTFDASRHAPVIDWFSPAKGTVIYLGVDFGYHFPYCVWAWKDHEDRLCFLREYMGQDMNTDTFWEHVADISFAEYGECSFRIFCDPAGAQKKSVSRKSTIPGEKDQQTDVEIIATVGREKGFKTHPEYHFSNVDTGIKRMRQMLKMRDGGTYGMMIDQGGCPVLVAAMAGGYHYEDDEMPDENPEKDGYYDHAVDGARMIVANLYGKPEGGIKVAPTQRQVVGEPTSSAKARRNVPTGPRIVGMAA